MRKPILCQPSFRKSRTVFSGAGCKTLRKRINYYQAFGSLRGRKHNAEGMGLPMYNECGETLFLQDELFLEEYFVPWGQ